MLSLVMKGIMTNHNPTDTRLTLPDNPQRYQLVALMVSGGSDSMAMLHMAARGELAMIDRTAQLVVIHVNHHLRDAHLPFAEQNCKPDAVEAGQSARLLMEDAPNNLDAQLVESVAAELGISCYTLDIDVASAYRMRPAASLEEVARRLRYEHAFCQLANICAQRQIDLDQACLATAHTATDRAETLMMRLMTGTSPAGLSARLDGRAQVIRPLQEQTREDLQRYLTERGLAWREDETNKDTAYLRAFVRLELLPLMQQRNPSVFEALIRTANLLQTEHEFLLDQAGMIASEVLVHQAEDEVVFDSIELVIKPRALTRRIVLKALQDLAGDTARITAEAVDKVIEAGRLHAQSGAQRPSATLAGALSMFCDRDGVVVSPLVSQVRRNTQRQKLCPQQEVTLEIVELELATPQNHPWESEPVSARSVKESAADIADIADIADSNSCDLQGNKRPGAFECAGADVGNAKTGQDVCLPRHGQGSVSFVNPVALGLSNMPVGTRYTLSSERSLLTTTGVLTLESVWDKTPFTYEQGTKRIYDVAVQGGVPTRLMSQVPAVFFKSTAKAQAALSPGDMDQEPLRCDVSAVAPRASWQEVSPSPLINSSNNPTDQNAQIPGCALPVCLPGIRVASPFLCTKDSHKVVKLTVRAPYRDAQDRSYTLKAKRRAHDDVIQKLHEFCD